MNGIEIKIENQIKYLGVIIDRKLNFWPHINYIYEKSLNKINKLPIVVQNVWGLTSHSIKLIYSAAIEPFILYCASIWGQNLTKTKIKKLRKIQRLIAIRKCKAYRTISFESVITIAGLIPIELKINEAININRIKHQISGDIEGLCQS